ncbi:MAG: alpha/beta fold hydrolase [Sphingomonadales bacterium]|nr:alpha/beta fold hydrolase [Sphingomonadales bacterium]
MSVNKPKLLMIPGLICDERLFAKQIEALQGGLDITVVDHARELTLSQMANDILDSVSGSFNLLGLSMGGYICFEVMRQAKLRGESGRIEKLVLCSTSSRQDEPEMAQRRRDFMALAKRGKFKGMSPMLMRTFIHPSKLDDKTVVKTIYDMTESTGVEGFINETNMILNRPDSRPNLPDIACETLIMCGEGDERTPLFLSEEMADLIPNSKLVVFEHCGHLPPLEQPAMVSKELQEFLL